DLGFDFYRFVIQKIRPVSPLADSVDGGAGQHRMTTFDCETFDRAGLADDGSQLHRPLNSSLTCQRWIGWLDSENHIAFRPVRDADGMGRSGRSRGDGHNGISQPVGNAVRVSATEMHIRRIRSEAHIPILNS